MNKETHKSKMTVVEAICSRRLIRNYTPQVIDDEMVSDLLDAAVHAPTAMH